VVLDQDFQMSESELNTHMALAFLRISRNCLVLHLLSSMVFTATVCQVSVSESVGTKVVVVVQTPIGHENYDFAIY
jgi:hypothetical protein